MLDYNYFKRLWEEPRPASELSDPAFWDRRADQWVRRLEEDQAYRARELERVEATAAFLRQQGLLAQGQTALDIGCGPGLFTVEFARTAGQVTGIDLSPRMMEHARAYARRQGVDNAAFLSCDFRRADPAAMGWVGAFDLVMTCLTPAVTDVETLHKVMSLSRGYCLHVSFVQSEDSLEEEIAAALYVGQPERSGQWDGRFYYAVLNLLFLEGYFPQTAYFRQTAEESVTVDQALAEQYADSLGQTAAGEAERILRFLQGRAGAEGCLTRRKSTCYGFLLWDVRQKRPGRTHYGLT